MSDELGGVLPLAVGVAATVVTIIPATIIGAARIGQGLGGLG